MHPAFVPALTAALQAMVRRLGASPMAGVVAALATVAGWTTWVVGTRHAMASGAIEIDPAGLAVIRFGIAALVLAPIWLKTGLKPKGVDITTLAGLLCAGAPFVAFVSAGLGFAPAVQSAPIITGLMPIAVAILSALMLGERLSRGRVMGLAVVGAGIAVVMAGGLLAGGPAWRGYGLFFMAALAWAAYSVSLKRSGLGALQAAAVVAVWSFLIVLPWGFGSLAHALATAPVSAIAGQVVVQGLIAGVFSIVAFSLAANRLGASRASAITGFTPVAVLAAAAILLGERFEAATVAGVVITGFGVVAASGLVPVVAARLWSLRPKRATSSQA
ncbi:DMT family transporter [Methylobrevis albus]|uniref:DMT family transporter n=1 Tax=Methylobrevis albus TaxID=2793297 RepID=A0A931MXN2_9HYPH|nr:DMT family transporter [Methylobrevis albus]MBH0239378.1 DMT family transporter [Methylobrevis albus]